jgi:hypothetical protein
MGFADRIKAPLTTAHTATTREEIDIRRPM